jgi:ammonia channel protein AmtB
VSHGSGQLAETAPNSPSSFPAHVLTELQHLVGGIVGGFLTGLFATSEGTAAFALAPTGGAIDGNGRQVWLQIVGFLFIMGWNIFWTSAICLFIKYVLRIPLRYNEEQLLVGDGEVHGELPYAFVSISCPLEARVGARWSLETVKQ